MLPTVYLSEQLLSWSGQCQSQLVMDWIVYGTCADYCALTSVVRLVPSHSLRRGCKQLSDGHRLGGFKTPFGVARQ